MHYPAFIVIGIIALVTAIIFIVFRTGISRGFDKAWQASISRPLIPTSPTFFLAAGGISIGFGIWTAVRAFF